MDRDQFNSFIDVFIQARNCQQALDILKMLSQNSQWEKESREKYPIENPDRWYEYIKFNIDRCIELIEGKEGKNESNNK